MNKQQPKLLDQLREAMRIKHNSLKTEKSYFHWVRRFQGENFYALIENSLIFQISSVIVNV